MKTVRFKIAGTVPLLMHSSQLSNPLNKWAKELKKVSAKRNKTEDDHLAMQRIETLGGLYWNAKDGYHMPGENIEACLIGAAKFKKLGTTFKRAAQVVELNCPLSNTGAPADPEQLADMDEFRFVKSVKVGTARVMRTRPIFDTWSTEFTVAYDETQLDVDSITEAVSVAGELVGLGDWRPRYGKFEVLEVA